MVVVLSIVLGALALALMIGTYAAYYAAGKGVWPWWSVWVLFGMVLLAVAGFAAILDWSGQVTGAVVGGALFLIGGSGYVIEGYRAG